MNIRENGQNISKELNTSKKFLTKSINEIPNVYCMDEGFNYLIVDKMENYPKDYYEPVWTTISAFQYKYTKIFNYLNPIEPGKNKIKYFCGKSTDNKNRFLRVLVQRKREI